MVPIDLVRVIAKTFRFSLGGAVRADYNLRARNAATGGEALTTFARLHNNLLIISRTLDRSKPVVGRTPIKNGYAA